MHHIRTFSLVRLCVVCFVCACVLAFFLGPWGKMRREAIAAAPASAGGENGDASAGEGQVGKLLPGIVFMHSFLVVFIFDEPFHCGDFSIANRERERKR